MKKSVYSLVLMDDVVSAIDRMAYEQGVSRSALVNRVLAEYASLLTPEHRIRSLFDAVCEMLEPQSVLQLASSEGVLTLRSSLQYKYNPVMRYTVEINREAGEKLGVLRACLRTQNAALIACLQSFYQLWIALETASNPSLAQESSVSGTKYTRVLSSPKQPVDGQGIAECIAGYVGLFDGCMKCFFANMPQMAYSAQQTEQYYWKHLTKEVAQL